MQNRYHIPMLVCTYKKGVGICGQVSNFYYNLTVQVISVVRSFIGFFKKIQKTGELILPWGTCAMQLQIIVLRYLGSVLIFLFNRYHFA